MFVPNFKILGQVVPEIFDENFHIHYTVQLLISDVCTKFQNSRSSSSREIFDKKFPYALLWSERLKKEKIEKESKINLST